MIMAAAVADYRPAEALATKRPKDRSGWTVELEPTTDVLAALGERRAPGQLLVGFAADQGERGLERAREKLSREEHRPVRLQRRRAHRHRLRRRRQRGDARRRTPASASSARRRRRRSRARSSTRWSACLAERGGRTGTGGSRRRDRREPRQGRARIRRDAAARRPLPRRRRAPDHRGLPGRREDDAREGARALARLLVLPAPVHARPAAVRRHRRQRLRPARRTSSSSGRARSSRTCCSSTRSTAPRRRRRRRCSSACRSRR